MTGPRSFREAVRQAAQHPGEFLGLLSAVAGVVILAGVLLYGVAP